MSQSTHSKLLLIAILGVSLGIALVYPIIISFLHTDAQTSKQTFNLYQIFAPEEQRNWTLNDWRVFLPAPVRLLIPFNDDVLAVTGIYGGVWSLKEKKWLLKYDRWFDPFDYEYVAGNGLNVLLIAGYDSPYILRYDGKEFKWIDTPTNPAKIKRAYGRAESTLSEDCYFLGADRYVYHFDPRTGTSTKKKAMFPREVWTGHGGAGRKGKVYFADCHSAAEDGGIWEYDPATDTLTRVYAGSIIMLREHSGGYVALEEYPAKGKQLRLVWTTDFKTFKTFILPESTQYARGVIEFGSSWNLFRLQEGNEMIFARGILYSIGFWPPYPIPWTQPNISPILGSPIHINDMAFFNGKIATAFFGDYDGNKYYSIISLLDPSIFFKTDPPLAYAIIWDNEAVKMGATSLPLVTNGWKRIALLFKSNTPGNLTLQVDLEGNGMWEDYITRTAITEEYLTLDGNFAMMRLKFSSDAIVMAKVTLAS